jgi:LuxR family transcriptional regulator, maltose regulon positive regulatory protein
MRSASDRGETMLAREAARPVAGERPLYVRRGARGARPGIEAAEPHRRSGTPVSSQTSRHRSRGGLEVVAGGNGTARGGAGLAGHNPQQIPTALAPARDGSVPRAHLLWAAVLLLLEAITDDAPSGADTAALALERDLGLAEPDRVLVPALIRVTLWLLERRVGHNRAEAVLASEIAGLLGEVKRSAPLYAEPSGPPLTESETRVLRYLPTHMRVPEIAAELFLSENTVRTHLLHLYRKLGAHSRREAVQRAQAIGLLAAPSFRI